MENKNKEYSELLELLAKKIKEMEEPISEDIVSDIKRISKKIIEPKRKPIIISEAAKKGIKGAKLVKQEDTPEYKKIVAETNERIRKSQKEQAEVILKAKNEFALTDIE